MRHAKAIPTSRAAKSVDCVRSDEFCGALRKAPQHEGLVRQVASDIYEITLYELLEEHVHADKTANDGSVF
jgi:hypothetical protein